MPAQRIERLRERDEVARDEPRALMDQLIERVLAVGSRLAPIDGAGLIIDPLPIQGDMLAVALHRQLLQIGRESVSGTARKAIPRPSAAPRKSLYHTAEQAHENRQIALERSGAEMLVHLRGSRPALRGSFRGRWQSWSKGRSPSPWSSGRRPSPRTRTCWRCRCRTWRLPRVRRNRDKMLGHRLLIASQAGQRPGAGGLRVGHGFQRGEGL